LAAERIRAADARVNDEATCLAPGVKITAACAIFAAATCSDQRNLCATDIPGGLAAERVERADCSAALAVAAVRCCVRNAARSGVQRAAALAGNRLRIDATLIPTRGAAVGIQVANGGAAVGILAIGQGVHRVAGTASFSSAGEAIGGGKIDAVSIPGRIAARWVDGADSLAAV
jgi:hypothetical protein